VSRCAEQTRRASGEMENLCPRTRSPRILPRRIISCVPIEIVARIYVFDVANRVVRPSVNNIFCPADCAIIPAAVLSKRRSEMRFSGEKCLNASKTDKLRVVLSAPRLTRD